MDIPVDSLMHTVPRSNTLGVGISAINLKSAETYLFKAANSPEFQGFVTVTGVHGVVESQKDPELKKVHNSSFMSTPDGMPMVWIGKLRGHKNMTRVYGPEFMMNIMQSSNTSGHRHYFFGGADGVASELKEKMSSKFGSLKIEGTMTPPFRPLNEDEEKQLYDEIQKHKPHFFWVGLSTPKQELFMHRFMSKFPDIAKGWGHGFVMLGVGAAFDFHSGRVRQAPYWIQRSGFEWLFRLFQDPKRLAKRYAYSNTFFLLKIIPQLLGLRQYEMPK